MIIFIAGVLAFAMAYHAYRLGRYRGYLDGLNDVEEQLKKKLNDLQKENDEAGK